MQVDKLSDSRPKASSCPIAPALRPRCVCTRPKQSRRREEARRIAANIAKLLERLPRGPSDGVKARENSSGGVAAWALVKWFNNLKTAARTSSFNLGSGARWPQVSHEGGRPIESKLVSSRGKNISGESAGSLIMPEGQRGILIVD